MPRLPRLFLSQSYYHIITRGNNRHEVFKSEDDYLYYLDLIRKYKEDHPFDIFHYCLMSNHVHLLIKTNRATDFSTFMKKLNLAYFQHYLQLYNWAGHFWQGRFKSQPVGKDEYFIQCGKYIELNPVRAGLVALPGDYRWSSYNHYVLREINPLITNNMFYDELGANKDEREKKYRDIIVSEAAAKSMHGQKIAIGTSNFVYNTNKKNKYHTEHKGSPYRQTSG